MKTIMSNLVIALFLCLLIPAGYADTVTTTTTTYLRPNSPVYTGTIQDVKQLEELTLEDFQTMGTKPSQAFQQYQDYKLALKNHGPDANAVPYKINIGTRQLTVTDFRGANDSQEVAQARYNEYRRLYPESTEVTTGVRYVYVYHLPV